MQYSEDGYGFILNYAFCAVGFDYNSINLSSKSTILKYLLSQL